MTMWLPDISERNQPRYQAIADAIAEAVTAGDLAPGDRLPPQRDLAWRLGVTVGTVSRGYALAEQKGLVGGEVGRGTYVREQRPRDHARMLPPVADNAIDLGINMACGAEHGAALASALARLSAGSGLENLLRYMPLGGHPEHRALAAEWIGRAGVEAPPERVVVTCGAQHALAVTLGAVAEPDATVLVEELTYPGVLDTARFVGRRTAGVAIDEEGMVPEALDRAARATGARAVVLVPTIHNPTAAIMGEARRRALAEVANDRDLVIVEDDVYGFLPEERPPAMATIAPERTAYLTSASKTLAPGLRVGWVVSPERFVQPIAAAVFASTVAQPALVHEVLRRWLDDGTAEFLLGRLRQEMAARQALAADAFAGAELRGHPASFHVFLYLPEPWTGGGFADAALSRGIRVTPAAMFATGAGPAPNAVRISVAAAANRTVLRRSLETLRDLLEGGPGPSRAIV